MAGESAHFDLRKRGPTPAVRPFDVTPTPMLKSMFDRAHAALAEPSVRLWRIAALERHRLAASRLRRLIAFP